MEKERNKGITLIALVITIVILIILATISINVTLNGALVEKAQTSKEMYISAEEKEGLILIKALVSAENQGVVTVEKYVEKLLSEGLTTNDKVKDGENGSKEVELNSGTKITITQDGKTDIRIDTEGGSIGGNGGNSSGGGNTGGEDNTELTVTLELSSDIGHGTNCVHVHTDSCKHIHDENCHTHIDSCYTTHTHTSACQSSLEHEWQPTYDSLQDERYEFDGPYCKYCKKYTKYRYYRRAVCKYCGENIKIKYCIECENGNCDPCWGRCTIPEKTLNCTLQECIGEGAIDCNVSEYGDCLIPTLQNIKKKGWGTDKSGYNLDFEGSNISQVKIGDGSFSSDMTMKVNENGTYTIQVQSRTGHIRQYNITITNLENI